MANLIDEYHRLLLADESVAHLDEILDLARRIASGGGTPRSSHWLNLLAGESADEHKSIRSVAVRRADAVVWALGKLPRHVHEHIGELPAAQYSLLLDALLIVFHQAYFALLPGLKANKSRLLQVFTEFSRVMPDPADQFNILGLVKLEEGDFEGAASAFRSAVLATPPDSHEFLTRVQMLWTQLIGRGRDIDAFRFLIEISPVVARRDLEEFNELLLESYREYHPQSRGPARTSA